MDRSSTSISYASRSSVGGGGLYQVQVYFWNWLRKKIHNLGFEGSKN